MLGYHLGKDCLPALQDLQLGAGLLDYPQVQLLQWVNSQLSLSDYLQMD